MKSMRKIRMLLATLFICLLVGSNVCYAVGETGPRKIGGSGIGYKEEIIKTSRTSTNAFITWHPDFSGYKKNVNSYFFISSSASISISIGGSSVSVSYNPASSSSGYSVSADPKRASRPAIYGDIYTITYKAGYYNFNTKKWSRTPSTKTRKEVRNTYVKVRYK